MINIRDYIRDWVDNMTGTELDDDVLDAIVQAITCMDMRYEQEVTE